MWQITQGFLNAHFTDVIIQKLIIRKFFNNYRACIRIKNKMIIMMCPINNVLVTVYEKLSLTHWKRQN